MYRIYLTWKWTVKAVKMSEQISDVVANISHNGLFYLQNFSLEYVNAYQEESCPSHFRNKASCKISCMYMGSI